MLVADKPSVEAVKYFGHACKHLVAHGRTRVTCLAMQTHNRCLREAKGVDALEGELRKARKVAAKEKARSASLTAKLEEARNETKDTSSRLAP